MDSKKYLKSFGWKEGEGLRRGGIKKPILVKHKYDLKGVGKNQISDDVCWWETAFDNKLKVMSVTEDVNDKIAIEEAKRRIDKGNSVLYQMFVKGETLIGNKSVEEKREPGSENVAHVVERAGAGAEEVAPQQILFFFDSDDEKSEKKKGKKKKKKLKLRLKLKEKGGGKRGKRDKKKNKDEKGKRDKKKNKK